MDNYLSGSASRNMHAVWRVILDFPGYEFKVPQYLIEAGINTISYDGGVSLDYGDPLLLEAMEQLITRLGKRYDGDKRLGFLQVGLLGFWGEWHTWGVDDAIPPGSQERVTGWFANSFSKTQIQTRYAVTTGYEAGFGRHDDSFAYNTLDGPSNGGVEHEWYFWPNVIELNQSDFWHRGATGGETSVQLQIEVFDPGYPARTYEKQDFMECVRAVHATYMFHHAAFKDGGFSGLELTNARRAHARMGYNFHVPLVSVKASSTPSTVDVDVTVRQIGVAPFYYDLLLAIQCSGMKKKSVPGVSKLTSNGESRVFEFTGLPATTDCLNRLALTLESSYIYEDRPIKFAQGNGTVVFRLPLPPTVIDYPETSPLSTNSVPSRAPSATSIAAKPRMVPSQNPAVATSPRIAPVGQIPIKKLTWPPFVGFPSNPV